MSVVIPTCDRPDLLAVTLHSVLWQQDVDIEVLVVDDGKAAPAEEVVEGLRDRRVRVLKNPGPAGVSGARNAGIAAAAGHWIAFVDDDDVWAPRKLAAQLAAADARATGWVYSGVVTVDRDLCLLDGRAPARPDQVLSCLRRYNAVPGSASSVVVRRSVLDQVGGFHPALRTSEDWDLWLRLASTGKPACVRRPDVALRQHDRMASRTVVQLLADLDIVAERHQLRVDRVRHERWAAWICLQDGRLLAALRHYCRAIARGDLTSLARAAVALVYPVVARQATAGANAWTDQARPWLLQLRAEAGLARPCEGAVTAGRR